jgi:hypothetical protein
MHPPDAPPKLKANFAILGLTQNREVGTWR